MLLWKTVIDGFICLLLLYKFNYKQLLTMKRFTVRVQLHTKEGKHYELDSEAYKVLHAEMERLGFTKTIESVRGSIHDLPSAEYNFMTSNDSITKHHILKEARKAGSSTGQFFSILVTPVSEVGRCWYNLDETEESED